MFRLQIQFSIYRIFYGLTKQDRIEWDIKYGKIGYIQVDLTKQDRIEWDIKYGKIGYILVDLTNVHCHY